jgi:hypothetical protein
MMEFYLQKITVGAQFTNCKTGMGVKHDGILASTYPMEGNSNCGSPKQINVRGGITESSPDKPNSMLKAIR